MSSKQSPKPRCFLVLPYSFYDAPLQAAIERGVGQAGFEIMLPNDQFILGVSVSEITAGELAQADCVIADISEPSPNVFINIGLAQAMRKALFLLVRSDAVMNTPIELHQYQIINYRNTPDGLNILRSRLAEVLIKQRQSPRPSGALTGARLATPFFIDWDRLERSEAENLCRELLAQMGFQRIDWSKETQEIDLIAEFPKKDPDGYEYRELWLISTGRNTSQLKLIEMAGIEPDYFVYRFLRNRDQLEARSAGELAVTLLFIFLTDDIPVERLNRIQERPFRMKHPGMGSLRIRVWDRNYLTSLVQQFPQIGYKYFSGEARFRSEHRKTAEELYKENTELAERQAATLAALEDEKNKRIRAERDAVWKDISFSAAHKIGNPIFAIETFLDPLGKRVTEKRTEEAIKVIEDIRDTVETAKGIVHQFTSLARAQKIEPVKTTLRTVLEKACQMCNEKIIDCEIECSPTLTVQADPVRLAECFDELFTNATHWLDKTPKKIQIQVIQPAPQPLPTSVDSSQQYTLIRFRDNGTGVALENKSKIFDAFFTKRDQGTGLGLALVRRVIEGHGGFIFEDGIPGQGADFEIYLPIQQNENTASAPVKARKLKGKGKAKNVTHTNSR